MKRRLFWVISGVSAVAVGAAAWLFWPDGVDTRPGPQVRARQYVDVDVCLLTDATGVGGVPAKDVWAGMGDVSDASRVRISHFPVAEGPAELYLSSLVNRRCSVIVAVGSGPVAAVPDTAKSVPDRRFVVVADGGAASGAENVVAVPLDGDVRAGVRATVAAALPRR